MPNLSDRYFEEFIKEKKEVTFTLLGKETVTGIILEKGRFALVVEVKGRPRLLFKHAIHSIELPKTWKVKEEKFDELVGKISRLSPEDRIELLEKIGEKEEIQKKSNLKDE